MSEEIIGMSAEFDPVEAALMPAVEHGVEEQNRDTPEQAAQSEKSGEGAADEVEEPFSYDGYQVVRGEFFAHIREPSIVFNNSKVAVNSACINKLTEVDYVQILINPDSKKLAVRPCTEDEKDSFLWYSLQKGKRKPKQITCNVFFAKLMQLMDWNPNYRYKLLGKLVRSEGEMLFSFDLTAPEIFQRITVDGEKQRVSRKPVYPAKWQNQFGVDMEEHQKSLQINIFNGYAVFSIREPAKAVSEENPSNEKQEEANHQ